MQDDRATSDPSVARAVAAESSGGPVGAEAGREDDFGPVVDP